MSSVTITDCSFTNIKTTAGYGAAIQFTFDSVAVSPQFIVKKTNFVNCVSENFSGGAIYASYSVSPLEFIIDSCLFLKNTSVAGGSSIFIEDSINFKATSAIKNCDFLDNSDFLKGTLAINLSSPLQLVNCTFKSVKKVDSVIDLYITTTKSDLQIRASAFTENHGFAVIQVKGLLKGRVDLDSVTIERNTVSYTLSYEIGTLSVSKCIISNNSGQARFSGVDVIMRDTKYHKNVSVEPAGSFNLYQSSSLDCVRCEFTQNSASSGGAIRVESKSKIFVIDSTFSGNSALENGGMLFMINSEKDSLLQNCTITENSVVEEGIIVLIQSSLTLKRVSFLSNKSLHGSPGIAIQGSDVIVMQSSFSMQEAKTNAFIYITAASTASFIESSFVTSKTQNDGGVGQVDSSSVSFVGCRFESIESAAGTNMLATESSVSFDNCSATNMKSAVVGSLLNISSGSLSISNSRVSAFQQTAVHAKDTSSISVTNSTFERGMAETATVFSVLNCKSFNISKSTFSQNSAIGVAAVLDVSVSTTWRLNSTLSISESSFEDNSASASPALVSDAKFVNITKSTFINNKATEGNAGAVELMCEVSSPCNFAVTFSNFTNNSAALNGGSIYWTKKEPYMEGNSFSNNSASYGADVASFGVGLKSVDFESLSNSSKLSRVSDNTYVNIGSGQKLPMAVSIALVDKYGQVVSTDNESIAVISPVDTANVTLTGNIKAQADKGVYKFDDIKISANPGVSVKLKVTSEALLNLPDDATGKEEAQEADFSFQVRECESGEALVGKECSKCGYGTYSLTPNQPCKSCPDGGICYGGNIMVPEAGYWRPNKSTDKFFKCPNQSICLGSPNIIPSLTGECSTGYRGNKCQACDNDFSRTVNNQCGLCPDKRANALRIVGVGILLGVVCGVMVWSSLKHAYKPKQLHSIYIKIFAGYIQLVSLTTQLDLSWPSFVSYIFDPQNGAASVVEQVVSFDCFLADESPDSYITLYYKKLIVGSMTPLILAFFALAYWSIHFRIYRRSSVFKRQLVATFVVLFFLVHPSQVKNNFAMFSCTEILSGEYWLNDNLDIRCYSARHSFYAITVVLPTLLVWGVGFPALILALLVKRKNRLNDLSMKLRFGFLYSGFRKSKFFWEFFIIVRKIIIICCVVFIGNHSIRIQALTITFILTVFLVIQFNVKPYNSVDLNKSEMYSILCAAVTLYCGVYYLTKDLDEGSKIFFFIVMIIMNLVYLVFFVSHLTLSLQHKFIEAFPFLRKALNMPPGNFFPESSASRGPLAHLVYEVEGAKVYSFPSSQAPFRLMSLEDLDIQSALNSVRSRSKRWPSVGSNDTEAEEYKRLKTLDSM
mmetsp:Transcript_14795/g.27383  ORF Transcript_14795/g.27383 Transcript_14795/m.27383 type:complete len:1343 (-) Transcript_14795:57-4085(-)